MLYQMLGAAVLSASIGWTYWRGRRATGARSFGAAYRAGRAQFYRLTGWSLLLTLVAMGLAFTLGGGLLARPYTREASPVFWGRAAVIGVVWTCFMAVNFWYRRQHPGR